MCFIVFIFFLQDLPPAISKKLTANKKLTKTTSDKKKKIRKPRVEIEYEVETESTRQRLH